MLSTRSLALLAPYAAAVLAQSAHYTVTNVPGYFMQDDSSTNATTFNYVSRLAYPRPLVPPC